jgi:CHAT domain-containing protein
MLEQQVSVFLGMLRRRDGSEVRGAERLGEVLMGDAFREVGDSIRRLVIVPDGCLHRLPFEALRPAPGREPLGVDHELAYAPSITLWTRWQSGEETAPQARVLALADPDLATVLEPSGERTVDPWVEGLRLGPLPHARREARSMVRSLRSGSRLVSGSEATERFLKKARLNEFGLLHFAAHAVVDPEKPERSAVLLAPGAPDEDGFLQIREIVDLDLDGQVVFLTTCRSASGTFIEGEGVLGLARAFFQAGARAVVGSLWPLRDDEAAALMEQFARHLGEGKSLAAALAEARRERIRSGAPVAAWSGLIVLGDGDLIPVPAGESRGRDLTWILAIAAVVAVTTVALLYRLRTRARSRG